MTTNPGDDPDDDPAAPMGPAYNVEGYDPHPDDGADDDDDEAPNGDNEGDDIFDDEGEGDDDDDDDDDGQEEPRTPRKPGLRDSPSGAVADQPRWWSPRRWLSP